MKNRITSSLNGREYTLISSLERHPDATLLIDGEVFPYATTGLEVSSRDSVTGVTHVTVTLPVFGPVDIQEIDHSGAPQVQ